MVITLDIDGKIQTYECETFRVLNVRESKKITDKKGITIPKSFITRKPIPINTRIQIVNEEDLDNSELYNFEGQNLKDGV